MNYIFDKYILGIYIGFLGKILAFILDIVTGSWILFWIFFEDRPRTCKILEGRSWQDIQDVERCDGNGTIW